MKKSDISEAIGSETGETFVVGESIYIRTISFHVIGRVSRISNIQGAGFLHLVDAAWIADSGRFTQAIDEGKLNEIEPVKTPVRVAIASIVDVYAWDHPLPRTQK